MEHPSSHSYIIMELVLKPKKAALAIGSVICLLILAGILGSIARYQFGITDSYVVNLFNLDSEKNIPTYFATIQLLVCAVLLTIIGFARKKQGAKHFWQWLGLAAVFLFLSMDEFIEIHEVIGTSVQNTLKTTGVFFFAWIIPYGLFVVGMLLAYVPFILRLPSAVKWLVIGAGFLYVTGALGMEAVASYFNYETGERGIYFVVLTTIEETLEMFGLLLFIYALLHYMDVFLGGTSLIISSGQKSANATHADDLALQNRQHTRTKSTAGTHQMLR